MINEKQEWFENKKQDTDAYESILMTEAGCMEGIIRGNVCFCKRECQDQFLTAYAGKNHISADNLENLKDNFVILISMISRICVENGMNREESIRICTLYIRSLDSVKSETEISESFSQMIMDYCCRMRELVYEKNKSMPVRKAIRYISEHFEDRPMLSEIASYAGISANYLSRRFHEELSLGITEWTHKLMSESAGLFIRYTDDSISDIANGLGCSSVSNFIQIFSNETNRTPNHYRQEFRMYLNRQITSVTSLPNNDQPNPTAISLTQYYLLPLQSIDGKNDDELPAMEYKIFTEVLNGHEDSLAHTSPDLMSLMNQTLGVLSNDFHNDQKYQFLICTALIMRLCIEHRLNPADAYHLSAYYVDRMEKSEDPKYLHQLMNDMLAGFAREMKNLVTRRKISKPIRQCIEYIYAHTDEKIRTEDLAHVCGKSVSWIAHTFPKETGISVKDYVQREKIASAKNMLHYTNLSFSEIASRLSFSSQSHFTLVFHNETGTTPGDWRRKTRAAENN